MKTASSYEIYPPYKSALEDKLQLILHHTDEHVVVDAYVHVNPSDIHYKRYEGDTFLAHHYLKQLYQFMHEHRLVSFADQVAVATAIEKNVGLEDSVSLVTQLWRMVFLELESLNDHLIRIDKIFTVYNEKLPKSLQPLREINYLISHYLARFRGNQEIFVPIILPCNIVSITDLSFKLLKKVLVFAEKAASNLLPWRQRLGRMKNVEERFFFAPYFGVLNRELRWIGGFSDVLPYDEYTRIFSEVASYSYLGFFEYLVSEVHFTLLFLKGLLKELDKRLKSFSKMKIRKKMYLYELYSRDTLIPQRLYRQTITNVILTPIGKMIWEMEPLTELSLKLILNKNPYSFVLGYLLSKEKYNASNVLYDLFLAFNGLERMKLQLIEEQSGTTTFSGTLKEYIIMNKRANER